MTDTESWSPVVLWSKPEGERAGTPLLVLFHGYMSNEQDLMGLVDRLPAEFTVASVRAPMAVGPGFAWFPLSQDLRYPMDQVISASMDVLAWLDGVREQHSSVSLLGFSMGMTMATNLLRHRPHDFAAVVGLSGFAIKDEGNPFFQDTELAATKIPFFWGRDQADPVITAEKIEYTHSWIGKHTALTKVLYAGMMHSINAQELTHVAEFLTYSVLRSVRH
ncbi:alpha/beta hydrolase [Arthrobacter roseus]|uniref:alpha/beta hydrolase n=1 Tax=Arthrobacter roseus TaxID=136274 RepID=UPI001965DA7E|nr:dienelactone hydrolase family protein [Arthrobacter roseus]MBM7848148.1 phospholipase/carboxylesterase [Arthrobacter roseus]